MKKITTLLCLTALLASNCVFAETNNLQASCGGTPCIQKCTTTTTTTRKEVKQPAPCPKQEFAWGIGLGGLLVIGAVVSATAVMASSN